MQIGLLGGTFDPLHVGHLILAERVRESAMLDEVWFLPSFQPPHKTDLVITDYKHRAEMVSRAIAGHTAFRLEVIEQTLPPPSYTAHTLAALQKSHPLDQFHLIVGADCLPDMPKWYEPQQILARAGLLAVPRPGVELWDAARLARALNMSVHEVRLKLIECPLIEIASRDLRRRVMEGKSIRYLVPAAVENYIHQHRLYSG